MVLLTSRRVHEALTGYADIDSDATKYQFRSNAEDFEDCPHREELMMIYLPPRILTVAVEAIHSHKSMHL